MVNVAPNNNLPYLPQGTNIVAEPGPGFEKLMGAAFRRENEIVSATRWMTSPTYEVDPTFQLGEALDASPYRLNFSETLAQAQSQKEFDAITGRIKQEEMDRQTLAAGGAGGIIAAMGAGLLSPTTLVPMTGGAKGLKGAAQAFALAGASIGAQEAVLFGTQETRTEEEVMIGIAAGTVLGGLLGSAATFLRKGDFDRAASDMGASHGELAMSYPSAVKPDGSLRAPEPMPNVRDIPEPEFTIPSRSGSIGLSPVRHIDETAISKSSPVTEDVVRRAQAAEAGMADAVARGEVTGVAARGVQGKPTRVIGHTDEAPIFIPVSELRKLEGVNGENAVAGTPKFDRLTTKVNKEGFEAAEHPVIIRVNHNGKAYIYEGNNRAAVAKANNVRAVAVEIQWINGADKIKGDWHPNNVIKKTYQKTDDQANLDAKANEVEFKKAQDASGESTAGAKATPVGRQQQIKRAGEIRGWVNDQFAKLNPVTRSLQQRISASASYWTAKLSDAGLKTHENTLGVAHAKGGTVEARVSSYDHPIAKALKTYHDAYGEHLSKGATPEEGKQISAFMANMRSGIQTTSGGRIPALPKGKMTIEEFDRTVFEIGNTGATHPDPAVMKAAAAQRGFFDEYKFRINEAYDHLKKANGDDPDIKPLIDTEGNLGPDVHEYINHIYDNEKIVSNSGEFKQMMEQHSLEILNRDFKKAHGKYLRDQAEIERNIADANLDDAGRAQALDDLGVEDTALRNDPIYTRQNSIVEGLRGELAAKGGADPELEKAIADAIADESIEYGAIAARIRAIDTRKKFLTENEFTEDFVKKLNKKAYDLEDSFDDVWRAKGAEGGDLTKGDVEFTLRAREDAEALYSRITGAKGRVAGLDILGAERGPELARILNLPFEQKRKFLVENPEQLMRIYGRQMAADIEIYRATGSPNGAKIFSDLADDLRVARTKLETGDVLVTRPAVYAEDGSIAKPAKTKPMTPELRAKELLKLDKKEKELFTDMTVQIERLRHQRGIPDDANSVAFRAGRAALSINVFRNMGMVAISSIPDVGRPVMKMGLMNTFKHAWAPLVTDLKRVKVGRKLANELGIALDPVLHNRSRAVFDVMDNMSGQQTKVEKGIEFLSNKTGFVAGFDRWTAEQKYLASSLGMSMFSKHIRTMALRTGSAKDLREAAETLAAHGIEADDADAIWKQFQSKDGSTEMADGVFLPNMESWVDYNAMSTYRAALNKFVDDTIVTPGLDRPNWVDANMIGRLVAQFRSFTFTSTNRTVMAGLQDTDMGLINGMTVSLATGALSYYLWAVATGGSAYEDMLTASEGEWADQAIARSGLLGVIAEPWSVLQRIPGLSDNVTFGGEVVKNRQGRSLMGAVAGPSFDLAEKLLSLALSMDDPTQADLHKIRQLGAYQNVFWLRRGLNQVEQSVAEASGLPERRGN